MGDEPQTVLGGLSEEEEAYIDAWNKSAVCTTQALALTTGAVLATRLFSQNLVRSKLVWGLGLGYALGYSCANSQMYFDGYFQRFKKMEVPSPSSNS
mmetsp:Transcript_19166/g.53801  ORF Transcript_19166/g.53801 Transcript_19166/m.53801 type:complete len:97 (-) Transcript_19166:91-381(-)